jgi:hypothetical protein
MQADAAPENVAVPTTGVERDPVCRQNVRSPTAFPRNAFLSLLGLFTFRRTPTSSADVLGADAWATGGALALKGIPEARWTGAAR